jgi:hypothetical protein
MAEFHILRREIYNVWLMSTLNYWLNIFLTKKCLEYLIFPENE